tara:strand:- start:52557 stop:52880 length:324 start_codon:yes stop_codon:yes gene_type:complete
MSETAASNTPPAYTRILPNACLGSSILFAIVSVVTWISILTISSYNVLIAFVIGLPVSLGGSLFLALLPTVILRIFLNDRRVTWSLWISGSAAAINAGVSVFVATMC